MVRNTDIELGPICLSCRNIAVITMNKPRITITTGLVSNVATRKQIPNL